MLVFGAVFSVAPPNMCRLSPFGDGFMAKNRVKNSAKFVLQIHIFGNSAQIWLNKLIIFSQKF